MRVVGYVGSLGIFWGGRGDVSTLGLGCCGRFFG